jgi:phage terminase small subunit
LTAEGEGSRTLGSPKVRAYLARGTAKTAAEVEIMAKRVLREIANVAFLDPRRIFAADGSLLSPHEWPDDIAAAVSSIDVVETQVGDDERSYIK